MKVIKSPVAANVWDKLIPRTIDVVPEGFSSGPQIAEMQGVSDSYVYRVLNIKFKKGLVEKMLCRGPNDHKAIYYYRPIKNETA